MPEIQNQAQYDAIYEAACARLAVADNVAPFLEDMAAGAPLYRYVGYRNALPQVGQAGRTVWTPLGNDTQNRWTGNGGDGNGHRGLYLSGEYLDQAVPFPELDHYMDQGHPPDNQVYYYHYARGEAPRMQLVDAAELRSMFLFTATQPGQGINLQMDAHGNHTLLQAILDDAMAAHPDAFADGAILQALYMHGDDASFCRAIGNAVLETTGLDYFKTTSVRDGVSSNVIYRAAGPQNQAATIDSLRPEGRASFLVRPGQGVEGVTTILDLQYNSLFEPPDLDVAGILPRDVQVQQLTEVATQMANNLAENYGEMLSVSPPNDAMEQVGARIQNLQNGLAEGDIQQAVAEIGEIRNAIAAQAGPDLAPHARQAFNLVDNTMAGLNEITDAIHQAQQEHPGDANDYDDIDLAEPDQEQFDPEFDAAHDQH